MTKPVLRFPEDVRDAFARRYRNQHRDWLAGEGAWPLETPLGCPTETEAGLQGGRLREWIDAWRAWRGRGQLLWPYGGHHLPGSRRR